MVDMDGDSWVYVCRHIINKYIYKAKARPHLIRTQPQSYIYYSPGEPDLPRHGLDAGHLFVYIGKGLKEGVHLLWLLHLVYLLLSLSSGSDIDEGGKEEAEEREGARRHYFLRGSGGRANEAKVVSRLCRAKGGFLCECIKVCMYWSM